MRLKRNILTVAFTLILCQAFQKAFSQLGVPIRLEKPKEYEDRVLRSEKSDGKKFSVPSRFIQNTVTHYNYYFNANRKINEVIERAKLAFKDDYTQLLPFYNYSLDITAQDSIQLDSVAYKAMSGIALHDLRNDWVDNLYLLWGASYYLRKEFDSAYLMFQFINYAFAPKEKDGYYKTIGSKNDGNTAMSISTKEKKSLAKKLFSEPPSRNDAFIWQIRNFLAQEKFAEAASLIEALRNDPVFPKRLEDDLHEVQALWFYKQQLWDSAAFHLSKALGNAGNLQEKARWEYLTAQLYEKAGKYTEAENYYAKVSVHTTDLILDIYARLAAIRVNKDEGEKSIDKNIAALLKMAKRDRYEDYRDIIYYMAAQMYLQNRNTDGALAMLLKSAQFAGRSNIEQRNKLFLQLAELSFNKKHYRQAFNFYDSVQLGDPSLKDVTALTARKETLGKLAMQLEVLERQDSLQRIALLPEDERKSHVRQVLRQLRRQQGLKDDPTLTAGVPFTPPTTPGLFGAGTEKGEWYFYNATARSRGQNEFRSRWGNRPNVDNWRRSASISSSIQTQTTSPTGDNKTGDKTSASSSELSFESLYERLPLTPEQWQESEDSVQNALFELGKLYIFELDDCSPGTETLEQLRSRFPSFARMDELLFNLFYCYRKNGELSKAEAIKKLMGSEHAASNFTTIVQTGKNPEDNTRNPKATQTYEDIYDLFIEGKFAQALARKKSADSLYGKHYWSPQLLYIEAVYHIRERQDSLAKEVLQSIISMFPEHALSPKATVMLDVLGRRKEIEAELQNLTVTRMQEEKPQTLPPLPPAVTAAPKTDSTKTAPVVPQTPVAAVPQKPIIRDSLGVKKPEPSVAGYVFNPSHPHHVILIFHKVDPVFFNESKNAFFRYNREAFYNKNYSLDLHPLDDDNRLLIIAPFANAEEALNYVDKTKPKAPTEIIPWLRAEKYSFSIISTANLELLKNNKDVSGYRQFLNQQLPGRL